MTGAIGDGGLDRGALSILQGHGHAANPRFTRILHAIPVQVVEHDARHRADLPVAEAGGRRAVGWNGHGDRVQGGRDIAAGIGFPHRVSPGVHILEGVLTTGAGGRRRHDLALVVEQVDLDAADPGFASVLNAVAVEVVERHPGDRAALPVAKVGDGGNSGGYADRNLVDRGGCKAGGIGFPHGVRTHRHAEELVSAAGVGGGRSDRVAGVVVQADGDAVEAGFAGVLNAIAVEVVEHHAADRARIDWGIGAALRCFRWVTESRFRSGIHRGDQPQGWPQAVADLHPLTVDQAPAGPGRRIAAGVDSGSRP